MIRFCFLGLLVMITSIASAHKPSDSYLRIKVDDDLAIRWDIALRDLEVLVGLDANQDGSITWGEVRGREELIRDVVTEHLKLSVDDEPRSVKFERIEIAEHSDGSYAALMLLVDQPGRFNQLTIDYDLLFDIDPTHRGLVSYQGRRGNGVYVISADEPSLIIQASGNGWWMPLLDYIGVGVWHICIGFDHILFLLALLLPSVWRVQRQPRKPACYVPHGHMKSSLWKVFSVVTCFTISHSLTLWLVVSDTIALPSRWVETTIAFSIVVTAIQNLFPRLGGNERWIAFIFGLVHGLGFGGVLIDLGLPTSMLVVALLGFNLGVELGQIMIVAIVYPILFRYRATDNYRKYVFPSACYGIAALGALWTAERALGITIFGG